LCSHESAYIATRDDLADGRPRPITTVSPRPKGSPGELAAAVATGGGEQHRDAEEHERGRSGLATPRGARTSPRGSGRVAGLAERALREGQASERRHHGDGGDFPRSRGRAATRGPSVRRALRHGIHDHALRITDPRQKDRLTLFSAL
jgi:hypothetical protein